MGETIKQTEDGLAEIAGGEHVTDIDKALETARQKQNEEILHEQVRMERLHVSAMCLQGILAGDKEMIVTMTDAVECAVKHADELLKAVMK